MIYLIDGKRQPENYFWNCLHVLASEKEICRVLDGEEIVIGKTVYRISEFRTENKVRAMIIESGICTNVEGKCVV